MSAITALRIQSCAISIKAGGYTEVVGRSKVYET